MEGASVDPFPTLEDVPVGYWPMIVVADVKGAAGIHLDKDGQPFALIEMSDSWSLTASHEALEMLADPWGNRLIPGRAIKQDQGRVAYLVEVCDPSEAAEFGYTVNDILVSDFYTPRYFDPTDSPATRYSFSGAIKKPAHGPARRLHLVAGPGLRPLVAAGLVWAEEGVPRPRRPRRQGGERQGLDRLADRASRNRPRLKKSDKTLKDAVKRGKQTASSAKARAASLREQISSLKGG